MNSSSCQRIFITHGDPGTGQGRWEVGIRMEVPGAGVKIDKPCGECTPGRAPAVQGNPVDPARQTSVTCPRLGCAVCGSRPRLQILSRFRRILSAPGGRILSAPGGGMMYVAGFYREALPTEQRPAMAAGPGLRARLPRIEVVDGLRAFAALSVCAFHFICTTRGY